MAAGIESEFLAKFLIHTLSLLYLDPLTVMSALVAESSNPAWLEALQETKGGFDFDNCGRNARLQKHLTGSGHFPQAKKTGTTICGIVLGQVVILAADTRATAGAIVADKNADKLHPIAPNIQCAGAGTSADLTATTEKIERDMEIHRLNTGTEVRVCTVVKRLSKFLFGYQGYIGCHLVLGGVDSTGAHLYQIHAHGSTDRLPFTAMGSGSLCAMSVLETRYREDMTVEEGKNLVADAIESGVMNDLGSGGNIDVCVIEKGKKEHTRAFRSPATRAYKATYDAILSGSTALIGKNSDIFKPRLIVEEGNTLDKDGDVVM